MIFSTFQSKEIRRFFVLILKTKDLYLTVLYVCIAWESHIIPVLQPFKRSLEYIKYMYLFLPKSVEASPTTCMQLTVYFADATAMLHFHVEIDLRLFLTAISLFHLL